MKQTTLNRLPSRGALLGTLPRISAALAACWALDTSALAQDAYHVSLTTSTVLSGQSIDDSSLLRCDPNGTVGPILTEGHWQALIGLVPGDVDALPRRVGLDPEGSQSLAFSFLSDTAGYKDGDVLGLDPAGGLQELVSEEDLLAALGLAGGNLDVDALDMGKLDLVHFSLQSDLPGSVLGDLQDGDVLAYNTITQTCSLIYLEDDMQAAFTLATGSTSAIGDVLGLCFQGNELLFSVQAPSTYDGAVLSMAQGGSLVRDEGSMGLNGGELSALSLAQASELPCFSIGALGAAPGDRLPLSIHGKPNTMYVALFAGHTGSIDFARRPGWGQIMMSITDTWPISTLSMNNLPFVVTDGLGQYTGSVGLPSAALYGTGFSNEEGWSFQMLEVPGLKLSAPFRVLKN